MEEALLPRSDVDVNRSLTGIDGLLLDAPGPAEGPQTQAQKSRVRLGQGLIWRHG